MLFTLFLVDFFHFFYGDFIPLIYLSVNFLLRRLAKGFSRGPTSDKRTAPTSLFPYSIKNGEIYDPSPEIYPVPGFKETDGRAP